LALGRLVVARSHGAYAVFVQKWVGRGEEEKRKRVWL